MSSSQGKKKRQHGNDAVKSHIVAARTVANIVRTSLVRDCTLWSKAVGKGMLKPCTIGTARAGQNPHITRWRHYSHE